jgi:hypothetical protein
MRWALIKIGRSLSGGELQIFNLAKSQRDAAVPPRLIAPTPEESQLLISRRCAHSTNAIFDEVDTGGRENLGIRTFILRPVNS